MSDENLSQDVLIEALKDTQQALHQLQNPLESLALTQLIAFSYKGEAVPGHINTWRGINKNIADTTATLEAVNLSAQQTSDYDALRQIQIKRAALDADMKRYLHVKTNFETAHPLIIKLIKRIDAIE
jgi:hypothetical protein